MDLLRSNDVVSSVDTGGKVFTEQELDKLLDRTDMVTTPGDRDGNKNDENNNSNDVNTTNDDNNNNEVALTKNKMAENMNSMESEENIEKTNNNNTHFKVIGVTNTENITF